MRVRDILGLATVLLLLACQTEKQSALELERTEQTRDPRVVVRTPVTCTEISDICARRYEELAGACLNLTEAADTADRADMRRCAVREYRAAIAHLPPASDKLRATRGLAEAVRISRDNSPNPAADSGELAALASQLQGMPGGAPYGSYYAANNDLFRVLTRAVPATQACAVLKSAQGGLPGSGVPADLAPRLATLRTNLATAATSRSCG